MTTIISDHNVRVIGIANGHGGRHLGCEEAAELIRDSEFLKDIPIHLDWVEIIEENATDQGLVALKDVVETCKEVAKQISAEIINSNELLVIGGDHSCAIGTWSGVASAYRSEGDIGLIWVDAHLVSFANDQNIT
ncbi:hypothetical protein AB6A40_002219 [Gnathostoma spinigerum]|uniref:Arginase n=1 Tax=Gnathostoma spinigerum TaxID=75299 RepID=A0ABD6EGR3_9BILA